MNIHHLQNALILSKKLHFTQAAEEINIVQPALSRQIRQLERELEIDLFKRTKRKVELTEAGRYFLQEAEKLLRQLDRIKEKAKTIQQEGKIEIRIGFTHSALQTILTEVIHKIQQLKPDTHTVLRELNNKEQFASLRNKEMDITIATNPIIPSDLRGKKISSNNFAVLLPPDHPVDQNNFKKFSVFSSEEFIFPSLDYTMNYPRTLLSICSEAGFLPKISHVASSASTCFKLIEKGFGIMIEPVTSLKNYDLPLKIIELKNIPQKAELTMLWTKDFELEHPEIISHIIHSAEFNASN